MPNKLSPLELARIVMRERREKGEVVQIEHLTPTEKAKKNPKSRKFAVDAKCYECQGFNADPAVKWRVGNCELSDCALFPVRPYQKMMGRPMPAGLALAMAITEEDDVEVLDSSEYDEFDDDSEE